jgi:hypothetical protein
MILMRPTKRKDAPFANNRSPNSEYAQLPQENRNAFEQYGQNQYVMGEEDVGF